MGKRLRKLVFSFPRRQFFIHVYIYIVHIYFLLLLNYWTFSWMLFVMSSRITSSFIKKNPISFWSCKNMTAMGNYCFWVAETLKISSETTNPNVLFVCTNNVCDVIHRNYSFRMNPVKNMAVMGNPFSDCQKFKKKSLLWITSPDDF